MPPTDPLVRLIDVLQPSLAMYLSDSGIWTYPGDEEVKLALADLVGDHRSLIERAAVMLEERGVPVATPAYPISFTSCHDVDIGSLVPRVTEGLQAQVEAIGSIVHGSGGSAAASSGLAAEARAACLRHIDVLRQVAGAERLRRAAATVARPGAAGAPPASTT